MINLLFERNTLCINEEKLFFYSKKDVFRIQKCFRNFGKKLIQISGFVECLLFFSIQNVVYTNIISDKFAMKILLYLNSLSVSKDTVVPAFQSRNCVSAYDINIVLLFSKSPRNTWKCDELNGNRLWFSVNRNIQFHGITLYCNYVLFKRDFNTNLLYSYINPTLGPKCQEFHNKGKNFLEIITMH